MAKKSSKKAVKAGTKCDTSRGLSGIELALECDISKQRTSQLEAEGVFVRNSAGRFERRRNVIAYIRRVRDESRESSRSPEAKRFLAAKAQAAELRNAATEGELIPIATVAEAVEEMVSAFRSELSGVPAASSRDLDVRASIEGHLNAAIERCRQRLEKLAPDIAAGRDPLKSTA
ncbi:MAG: hypothetical protein KIT48_12030 [Pseudolabrys sp.]|nr:hypothetical protein [Pseudolabrys sp.]